MRSSLQYIWTFFCVIFVSNSITLLGQNFINSTESFGINSHVGNTHLGSGLSVFDFDNDGWEDLSFGTDLGDEIHFYKNINGTHFQRISGLIADGSNQKAVVWVDFDNDNDYDLFIASFNNQNKLFQNNGSFNFTDITTSSGLVIENSASYGAVFADVNKDGFLDLYVSNWTDVNRFYINDGAGAFVEQSGLIEADSTYHLNFASGFFDFDNDGDVDLYKSNDRFYENQLFRNDGNLQFTDVGNSVNANIVINAMNVAVGDINNDGLWDLYITDGPDPGCTLLSYNGSTYENLNPSSNSHIDSWIWGASFADFDNDGFQDIYASSSIPLASHPNELLFNNGDETFTKQDHSNMPADFKKSYATVTGDINNDGKMDIITSNNSNALPSLWLNNIANNSNYIKIHLIGAQSNSAAIGSRIEIYCGNDKYYRFTQCGTNYMAQESQYQHVGILHHQKVDSIKVTWPRGQKSTYRNIEVNQLVSFHERLDYPIYACSNKPDEFYDNKPIRKGEFFEKYINASGTVSLPDTVQLKFEKQIELAPDFQVKLGSHFITSQSSCYP